MKQPEGFTFLKRKSGEVQLHHHGKLATTLRGTRAADFLDAMDSLDHPGQQDEMARLTGNYKRGNERLARHHPRNR